MRVRTSPPSHLLAEEIGTIRKDPGGKLRIALLYPNTYAIGMSNLGVQTLYRLLNARPDVVCERAFLPADSSSSASLRTLESDTPLRAMDVLAFSVSFELDYPNIPRMLRLAGIAPFAAERQGPLVMAGGATVSYNPEPIAPFLDLAVIGEAEDILDPLIDALHASHTAETLEDLAALPGIYLPALGTPPIARLVVDDLNREPAYTQVFTPRTEFGTMGLVEVGRGCPYGCLFCVASHVYRPARWRSLAALLPVIERGLMHRRRVGLIGASVTDHPDILTLCDEILRRNGQPSPASMRADALTDDLLGLLARGGVRSITLAPEAATETLRRQTGKRLTDAAILAAAMRARAAGISDLKLYFIIGLPGETDEDVAGIPALVQRVAEASGMRISVGCSVFVPKPGTPFARQAMISEREARRKFETLRRGLPRRTTFTHESARWAYWQAVLARAGREMAPVLDAVAVSDGSHAAWQAACQEAGIDADRLALHAIAPDAPVPWAHIGGTRCCAAPPGTDGS